MREWLRVRRREQARKDEQQPARAKIRYAPPFFDMPLFVITARRPITDASMTRQRRATIRHAAVYCRHVHISDPIHPIDTLILPPFTARRHHRSTPAPPPMTPPLPLNEAGQPACSHVPAGRRAGERQAQREGSRANVEERCCRYRVIDRQVAAARAERYGSRLYPMLNGKLFTTRPLRQTRWLSMRRRRGNACRATLLFEATASDPDADRHAILCRPWHLRLLPAPRKSAPIQRGCYDALSMNARHVDHTSE